MADIALSSAGVVESDLVGRAVAPVEATAGSSTPPRGQRRGRTRPASLALRTVALLYVTLLVLMPVVVLLIKTFQPGLSEFFSAISQPDAIHAYEVSAVVAGISVVINTIFGIGAAILLARYSFPGKRLLNALIDLPVAVSPIVVGLALILVYGSLGWFGTPLSKAGIQIIYAKPAMVLATVFVSLPLVVRAIVPVLEQAGTDQEQAAASLGANAVQRFVRITLPSIRIALTYGVVLALARCIGEFGAVLVVSGNIAGQTETAPLYVRNRIDLSFDYNGAYAVTFLLILVAFLAIIASAIIRRRQAR